MEEQCTVYSSIVRFVQARTTSKFNYSKRRCNRQVKRFEDVTLTYMMLHVVIALVGGALYKKALHLSHGELRSY